MYFSYYKSFIHTIFLASFYIVILIAALGMKSDIIYRKGNQTTTVYFLSNVLRNPGSEFFLAKA